MSNFDRDSVDDFDTTGDDLYRVVMELDDLFNFLESEPLDDPAAIVDLIFEPGYPYRQQILVDFTELTDNDWHYVDPGVQTVAVEVVEMLGVDRARVTIADTRGEQVIADADGNVVKTYPGWSLDAATYVLRRGEDGRWRYEDVGEFHPITDAELEQMVPVEWTGRSG